MKKVYSMSKEELKKFMGYLGSKTSEKKAASARANGAKGGRPVTKK
jgi:hypothetical protein